MRKLMDASRARALGFAPEIDLADGVASFVREYRVLSGRF
jgi:nucleoside-diphosphate-sugar epimerase